LQIHRNCNLIPVNSQESGEFLIASSFVGLSHLERNVMTFDT